MPAQFPWRPWLAASLAAGAIAGALVWAEGGLGKELDATRWIAVLVATAPLVGAQIVLGCPVVAERVRAWVDADARAWLKVGGGVAGLFAVAGLGTGKFDPYMTAIFALGVFGALGALREVPRGTPGLTWTDAAVWLLIWIPFDLRWNKDLGPAGFTYPWWSIALSVVAVIGWGTVRDLPGFGYRLVPNRRDLGIAGIALLAFGTIAIAVGLAIGFLHFPPTKSADVWEVAGGFVGLFFTVAIPEELFFRAILQRGLEARLKRPGAALVLASLAFGLMHWNNESVLKVQIEYCVLAAVAGLFYGWAYRRSGALIAPVLVHTLTDLVWKFAFK